MGQVSNKETTKQQSLGNETYFKMSLEAERIRR